MVLLFRWFFTLTWLWLAVLLLRCIFLLLSCIVSQSKINDLDRLIVNEDVYVENCVIELQQLICDQIEINLCCAGKLRILRHC